MVSCPGLNCNSMSSSKELSPSKASSPESSSKSSSKKARSSKGSTLSPRKAPSQARARATVERILQATRQILRERGGDSVTTRSIAEVSGVRTGSIYQYFPNKASILYALYGRRMEQTVETLEMAISPERLAEMDFEQAWNTFTATILSIGWGTEEDVELDKAMGEDPELRKAIAPVLSRLYALLCRFMRRYGSDWPEPVLMDTAEYIFNLNHFGYATRIRQSGDKARLTSTLTRELERYLIEKAINTPYSELH